MTEDNRIPEPMTRDAVLARVIEEANEQVDDDWTTADTLAFREYFGERLASRLAEAGLLADPEQHTELEQLRSRITRYQEELDKARSERANAVATSEAWKQERDDLETQRDQLRERKQADLDELKRTLGLTRNTLKQNVEWRDRFRAERDEDRAELGETRRERDILMWLHAEAVFFGHGWHDQWMSTRETVHKRTAERDERQARIDAALALLDPKVIGKGDAFTREEDIAHFDGIRAVLVGEQPSQAERPFAARLVDAAVFESLRLSGVALRDVEERDDAAGDLP